MVLSLLSVGPWPIEVGQVALKTLFLLSFRAKIYVPRMSCKLVEMVWPVSVIKSL